MKKCLLTVILYEILVLLLFSQVTFYILYDIFVEHNDTNLMTYHFDHLFSRNLHLQIIKKYCEDERKFKSNQRGRVFSRSYERKETYDVNNKEWLVLEVCVNRYF